MATKKHNLSQFDSPLPSAAEMRFGIVVAEWNREVTEALLEGAVRTLRAAGCPDLNIQIKYVPGTFELALGAQFFAEYTDVDAVIALGCVIQGDTRHFDFICQGVTQGITQLQIQWNMPIAFGVLTVNDMQQALDRCAGRSRWATRWQAATATRAMKRLRQPSTWSSCRSTWKPLPPTTNPTGGTSTDDFGTDIKGSLS
jgi:6,7-dimethyl-8-ribityllumazine synthase